MTRPELSEPSNPATFEAEAAADQAIAACGGDARKRSKRCLSRTASWRHRSRSYGPRFPPATRAAGSTSRAIGRIGTTDMTEVTYYVALPFIAADDGIAAGEATECFGQCRRDAGRGAVSQARHPRRRRVPP